MYSPSALDQSLGYWMKLAQHAFHTRMEDELRPLGLTVPQYAVLTHIETNPGQSNADLARRAFITAQSMQGVLANLETQGLVQRTADAAHGRRQPAQLTAEGRAVLAQAHSVVAAMEEKLDRLTAPLQRDDVLALLMRIQADFI